MSLLKKRNEEKNLILYEKYLSENKNFHVVEDDENDLEESRAAINIDWKRVGRIAAIVCLAILLIGGGTAIGYINNEKVKTKIDKKIETVRNEVELLKGSSGNNNSSQNVLYDKESLMGADGADGIAGADGQNGMNGENGTNGKDGINGENGLNGKDGINGQVGVNGKNGANGKDGKDGQEGVSGKEGINGINGENGISGINGQDGISGINGQDGKSTYELAVEAGFTGSESDLANTLSTVETRVETVEDGVTTLEGDVITLNDSLKEVFTSVSSGKAQVASAITDKGVKTESDAKFKVMHDNILTLATQQYQTGYADGLAAANNASITFVKHYHTGNSSAYGGCYTIPNYHRHVEGVCWYKCASHTKDMMVNLGSEHHSGKGDYTTYRCSTCGIRVGTWSGRDSAASILNGGGGYWGTDPVYRCGKTTDTIDSYASSCGYTEGQILSATIKY